MKTFLIEPLDLSEATVDTAERVIRNVTLIKAGMSQNRRFYAESVLQNAATIFEGAKAFDSHAKGERRVGDITGWYANVRYHEGKLVADRYFTRTRAADDVLSVVEDIIGGKAPRNLAGLSINAAGTGKVRKFDDGDALEVESISVASSVDDVVNPAAGGAYALTASGGDELRDAVLESITFEEFNQVFSEHIERLKREWKTTRQDEALKAAKADAERVSQALTEAQTALTEANAARDAALSERDTARRELSIVEALASVKLPAKWKADLRETLAATEPSQWKSIIEREIDKAKAAGHQPRVPVGGAGQAVDAGIRVTESFDPRPRDGEDVEAWLARMSHRS